MLVFKHIYSYRKIESAVNQPLYRFFERGCSELLLLGGLGFRA